MTVVDPAHLMSKGVHLHPEYFVTAEGEREHPEECSRQYGHHQAGVRGETAYKQPEQATGGDHQDGEGGVGVRENVLGQGQMVQGSIAPRKSRQEG